MTKPLLIAFSWLKLVGSTFRSLIFTKEIKWQVPYLTKNNLKKINKIEKVMRMMMKMMMILRMKRKKPKLQKVVSSKPLLISSSNPISKISFLKLSADSATI